MEISANCTGDFLRLGILSVVMVTGNQLLLSLATIL
jgi:hypothetical protein